MMDAKSSTIVDNAPTNASDGSTKSNITMAYKNISIPVAVPKRKTHHPRNVLIESLVSVTNLITCGVFTPTETFYRLENVSGVVEPGQMTLVIAPPGHGKSSYLKALAGRLKLESDDSILFNGRTRAQARQEGCDVMKMVTYIDQIDAHIPVLTVDETLEFTHQMSSSQFSRERIDRVIEAFHMEECRSTVVGDHSVRGISGGQKRRVTVMEACLSDACMLFLDEFTNGLDSAVAERLCDYFRTWCRDNNTSVVATLQQPTPVAFNCFDRIVVLREGCVVYDGPREDVLTYFEGMGFRCPDDVDTCDFIIDCISQPLICYKTLKHNDAVVAQAKMENKDTADRNSDDDFALLNPSSQPSLLASPPSGINTTASSNSSSPPFQASLSTTLGPLYISPLPCIRTDEMIDYFESTPFSLAIRKKLSTVFPTDSGEGGVSVTAPQSDHDEKVLAAASQGNVDTPDQSSYHSPRGVSIGVNAGISSQPPLVTDYNREMYRLGYRLSLFQTLMYVIHRQIKLQYRNYMVFIPRLCLAVLISLNFGGLYFNIAPSEYVLRFAAFTESSTEMAYNNLVELGLFVNSRRIVHKQLHMYPTYLYVFSALIVSIPFIMVEVFIFSIMLFFLMHHNWQFVTYVLNYLVLFLQSLSMISWFRFGAACARDIGMAYTIVNPITMFAILANGFYSTPDQLPPFMIWLYWISPFSWGFRSLSLVEFTSRRYDDVFPRPGDGELVRIGDTYLDQQGIAADRNWIVYGILFHIATIVLFNSLTSWLLYRPYTEHSIGTQRFDDDDVANDADFGDIAQQAHSPQSQQATAAVPSVQHIPQQSSQGNQQQQEQQQQSGQVKPVEGDGTAGSTPSLTGVDDPNHVPEALPVPSTPPPQRPDSSRDAAPMVVMNSQPSHPHEQEELSSRSSRSYSMSSTAMSQVSQSGDRFGGPQPKLTTLTQELSFHPVSLTFHNITYTVPVKLDDGKQTNRVLLNNISGAARPGKLIALMGASGAGKTTLLDVLANRKTMGQLTGTILVNGKHVSPRQFAKVSGYVEQFDTLFAYSTVRETLLFAARLRLPADVPESTRIAVVDEVLDILDLRPIEMMMLGDSSNPILSPSQLKRISIGVELVANPSVLFLDEPTTGLDSKSAQTVMRVVRRIARSGRSVICTIHQPSAELFFLFDQLVLLGPGGYQLFFGDIGYRGRRLIRYFSKIPGVGKMPLRSNPASWVVDIVAQTLAEKDEETQRDGDQTKDDVKPLVKLAEDHYLDYYMGSNVNTLYHPLHGQREPLLEEYHQLREGQRTIRYYNIYYWNHPTYMALLDELESKPVLLLSPSGRSHQVQPATAQPTTTTHNDVAAGVEMAQFPAPTSHVDGTGAHAMIDPQVEESTLLHDTSGLVVQQSQSYLTQWILLFGRNKNGLWRNSTIFLSRIWFVLISVFYGLLYFQLDISTQAEGITLLSAIIMATTNVAVVSASNSTPFFHFNRPVFYRERFSGFYAPLFWNLSIILIELIAGIFVVMVSFLSHYFLIGLSSDPAIVFKFYLTCYIVNMIFIGFGLLASSLFDQYSVAELVFNFYLTIVFSYTGIGMTLKSMRNGFFLFLFRVLPFSHAAEAWVMPEFDKRTEPISFIVDGVEQVLPAREWVSYYLGYEYGHYWTHNGWLLLTFVIFSTLSCIASVFLIHSKR